MVSPVECACVTSLLALGLLFGMLALPGLGHRIVIRHMAQDAEGDVTHTIALTVLPGATQ
jgi:hypothetical protein